MVFGFQDQTCGICGERFEVHEERLHYGTWGHRPYVIYHFRCVDFDTRLNRDDRGLWASWKLQQVEEATSRELAALRGRTTALYELALRLMSQLEWTSDDIEDFKYEYGYRDQGSGEEVFADPTEG
jgi:hypothetical protein